jgi:hypothetical protein
VIEVLKREVAAHRARGGEVYEGDGEQEGGRGEGGEGGMQGERAWTVEVATTATICNLITDFSPLKAVRHIQSANI